MFTYRPLTVTWRCLKTTGCSDDEFSQLTDTTNSGVHNDPQTSWWGRPNVDLLYSETESFHTSYVCLWSSTLCRHLLHCDRTRFRTLLTHHFHTYVKLFRFRGVRARGTLWQEVKGTLDWKVLRLGSTLLEWSRVSALSSPHSDRFFGQCGTKVPSTLFRVKSSHFYDLTCKEKYWT